ncbi:MAG: flagellar hook-length control protein FliK [Phycisphaerales bacterium]|nr:MAG: flagellar hook-length control protein FliK [Phycisphaerales bacterium]
MRYGAPEADARTSSTAFDALLAATRAMTTGVSPTAGDIPENQMFEVPKQAQKGGDEGRHVSENPRPSLAERIEEDRGAPWNIKARRAFHAAQLKGASTHSPGKRDSNEAAFPRGAAHSSVRGSPVMKSEGPADAKGNPPEGALGRGTGGSVRGGLSNNQSANNNTDLRAPEFRPALVESETAARTASVRSVAPSGPSSEQGPDLARQVGRILASSGRAESQSGRALATLQHAGTDGKETPHPKSAPQAEAKDQSSSSRTAKGKDFEETFRSSFERLVRSIRLSRGPHWSSARLQLHPPELGRMKVELRLSGDTLQIDVLARTSEARELLYERVAELKAALEQHGLRIERFAVDIDQRGVADGGLGQATQQERKGNREAGNSATAVGITRGARTRERENEFDFGPLGASREIGLDWDALEFVDGRRLDIRV